MKLLLNENLPKRLKLYFVDHEIFAVHDKSWSGKANGDLLKLMISEKFDRLITFDKNLTYQQNFSKYTIPVLVLNAAGNRYETLKSLVPRIKIAISQGLIPGPIEIK